jgi:anti-sigma factor RsiW
MTTGTDCTELEFLLQADFDGELDASGAASVAAHLAHCPDCRARQVELSRLSSRLRTELPYYAAPAHLRRAVEASIAAERGEAPAPAEPAAPRRTAALSSWAQRFDRWIRRGLPVGIGAVVAAVLVLALMPPRGPDMEDRIIASHIRALQPGHLMDVISTDKHTVKPWFDGRLDYAPPVKDLASAGFPLLGGRLDYLATRPVAALAYRRDQHMIDFYVWPVAGRTPPEADSGEHKGYNYIQWTQDNMVFCVVSDLEMAQLHKFVELWRAAA